MKIIDDFIINNMEIENLKVWMYGGNLTTYQKGLALCEFDKLIEKHFIHLEKEILINKLEIIKEILNPIPVADNEWAIEKLTELIKLLENEQRQ